MLLKKIVIYVCLLIATQLLFFKICGSPSTFIELDTLKTLLRQKYDVIYLGDSVLVWIGPEDKDRRSIADILQEKVPTLSIGKLRHAGYSMPFYFDFCRYIKNATFHPKKIIIPINLGTIGKFEHESVSTFLKVQHYILQYSQNPIIGPFLPALLSFKWLGGAENEKFYPKTFSRENTAKYFRLTYLNELNKNHPHIISMVQTATLFKESDTELIFYFTPIDIQDGVEFVGPSFPAQIENNVELIKSVLKENGLEAIDLSNRLSRQHFLWRTTKESPDEHLDEVGRQFVAEQLALRLKSQPLREISTR